MIYELNKTIKKEDGDSMITYQFRTKKYTKRLLYGSDKKQDFGFI